MNNKTSFGFEKIQFVDWEGLIDNVFLAYDKSRWCLSATRAAVDTWKETYADLQVRAQNTEAGKSRLKKIPPRLKAAVFRQAA